MDEILDKISAEFEKSLYDGLQNNELLRDSNDVRRLISWYKESEKGRVGNLIGGGIYKLSGLSKAPLSMTYTINPNDKQSSKTNDNNDSSQSQTFSKILSKLVELLSKQISLYLVKMIVKNVQIETKEDEKSLLFDLSFKAPSIKPYVEFVKKINGVQVLAIRTVFKVDLDASLKKVKLRTTANNKTANIEEISVRATISIKKLANISVTINDKSLKIYDSTLKIDVSKFYLEI